MFGKITSSDGVVFGKITSSVGEVFGSLLVVME